jgi:hypothetical protein
MVVRAAGQIVERDAPHAARKTVKNTATWLLAIRSPPPSPPAAGDDRERTIQRIAISPSLRRHSRKREPFPVS